MGAVASTVSGIVLLLIEEFAETGVIAAAASAVGAGDLAVESIAAGIVAEAIAAAVPEAAALTTASTSAALPIIFSGTPAAAALDLLADVAIGTAATTAATSVTTEAASAAALGSFFANQSINIAAGTTVAIASAIGLTTYIATQNYDLSLGQVQNLVPTIDQAGEGLYMNYILGIRRYQRNMPAQKRGCCLNCSKGKRCKATRKTTKGKRKVFKSNPVASCGNFFVCDREGNNCSRVGKGRTVRRHRTARGRLVYEVCSKRSGKCVRATQRKILCCNVNRPCVQIPGQRAGQRRRTRRRR
ncbi:VP2 [Scorpion polyomavirus 2]|nr:VP2 [Scorpion polyomavirus 2]QTH80125.1 VP2 [Scorpion polyomavirus 2]QTH80130.1 VP2 [Scorpion polyomavirus 2]